MTNIKIYLAPTIEITPFCVKDVILSSGGTGENDLIPDWDMPWIK